MKQKKRLQNEELEDKRLQRKFEEILKGTRNMNNYGTVKITGKAYANKFYGSGPPYFERKDEMN